MSGRPTFSAVLLAAGLSSRMGERHKLLLPLGAEPVVRHTARALLASGPVEVVAVTGHRHDAVSDALAGLPLAIVFNPRYREGQMTSVAAGVAALRERCDAVMVCLADQVLLRAEDYLELIDAFAARTHGSIVVPFCGEERGNPVVFAASHMREVAGGAVNPGCRRLIAERPEEVVVHRAGHGRFCVDMDTAEDFQRVAAELGIEVSRQ